MFLLLVDGEKDGGNIKIGILWPCNKDIKPEGAVM
jgi:hypothetical protein